MNDYVSKPVDPGRLIELLEEHARGLEDGRPESEPRAPLPSPVPFDVDDLLGRFEGRSGELRAAIANLDRRAIDCLGQLRFCLSVRYGEKALSLVSALREALALISSHTLHALAIRLEERIADGAFDEALEDFEGLKREFSRCRSHLPEVLARAEFE